MAQAESISARADPIGGILTRALGGERIGEADAIALIECADAELPRVMAAAAALRDRAKGRDVTFSPKVFLPITNLCRDRCSYCTFRKDPDDPGAWTMTLAEVAEWSRRGRELGCHEALMCLGDKPELAFREYRETLRALGARSTIEHVARACATALDAGLLPHTNAGIMTRDEMATLRPLNVSMGLMLESVSPRLRARGGVHQWAPDKEPAVRLKMIDEAGALRIPFTTGILIGIGDTPAERAQSLLAIRASHERHGQIQEVIIQNFRAKPGLPLEDAPEPGALEMARAIATARLTLGGAMNVQAPPNLSPHEIELFLAAGINDWGGISPLSRDYVNPEAPWPHLERLHERCARAGFQLKRRLAIYPEFINDEWVDPALRPALDRLSDRIAAEVPHVNLEQMRAFADEIEATPLNVLMNHASGAIRAALLKCLDYGELTPAEGLLVYTAEGDDLRAVVKAADLARAEDAGEEVTYVVNRNINFTNICFVGCQFCGFKRQKWEADAYDHSDETILAKVGDAIARGATEICMQGGINPDMPALKYRDLLVAIKSRYPRIHIHAFSPMEIMYGARRTRMEYREYIAMLRDAGLGSIPGTAAEILDDSVREILSHKKVDVAAWVDIITTAHELGVPTTSTIMYGHIESPRQVVNHLDLIRTMQKRTGGFTEFVPLRFIHENTVLYRKGLVRPSDLGLPDFRMYAFARLFLRGLIDNIQTSWVKLGVDFAAVTLKAGCNDFSGTLMEESITALAGGTAGEFVPVDLIEDQARAAGRVAVERTTLYKKLYGRKAPNGARPIAPTPLPADHHAGGGSGCG